MRDRKITPSQLGVLDTLYHIGPMQQQELAEKNLMSPGNITMIVDNLAKRGLVRRRRQEKDRRSFKVYLTAEGKKLFEEMFPRHVQSIVDEFEVLTDAERKELARLCRKLGLQRAD
ncbi:MarR family winged helix-turn-helix transcriptional regulator [Thermodesulfobacteriota bacterium]